MAERLMLKKPLLVWRSTFALNCQKRLTVLLL